MAEALGRLVAKATATDLASTRPPVPEMVVVLHDTRPDEPVTLDGIAVKPGVMRVLSCAASIVPAAFDRDGNPLWMGDRSRLATPWQRRALAVRDGGCVFPGCDSPVSWTDAHHVTPWEHDGPTDIDNLCLLCRFHHGVVHRKRWQMHATNDQWFWFRTPNCDTFWSQRHGRPRAGPTPLAA
jgi:hypothetical protein